MLPLKDTIPHQRFPVVTVLAIAGTVVAYLVAQRANGVGLHGTLTDARLLPLGLSLLFLWLFGNTVEDATGRGRFAVLVLTAGLGALVAQRLMVAPDKAVATIALSGAVAGVLGAHVRLHPRAGVVTGILIPFFVTLVELPATVFLVAWFVLQLGFGLLEVSDPTGGAGLAAAAATQAAGVLIGLALIGPLARPRAVEGEALQRRPG